MPDPIQSKLITVTASATADQAIVRILNRRTGDIWTETMSTSTTIIDLANNTIWGNAPVQWVNGDVLEIMVFHNNIGGGTWTLVDGLNEPTITMATDTAVQLSF